MTLLLLLSLGWQAPGAAKLASVSGVVIHAVTGAPIAGVTVGLEDFNPGGRRYDVLTGDDGKFEIKDVEPGRYWYRAKKGGFTLLENDYGFNPATQLKPDEVDANNKLKLVEDGSISGRVLDAQGDPVEHVTVEADKGGGFVGRRTTNDRGEFRITGLTPGRYLVRAAPALLRTPPEIRTDGSSETQYAVTYHPDSVDPGAAVRVDVKGGLVEAVDIRLARQPIVRVSGTVTGWPTGALNLFLPLRQGRHLVPTGTSVKEGRFTIWRLSPGRYTILAACQGAPCAAGRVPVKASAPVEFTVGDQHVDNLELALIPAFDVSGRLVWDRPPDDPKLAKFEGVRVALSWGTATGGYSSNPAKPTEDGTFVTPELMPTHYRVAAESPGVYVKSVQLGPAVMPADVVDLRRPPGADVLTVTLSTGVAQISGLVHDAKGPKAGAMLALIPATPDQFNRARFTTADAAGRYDFRGIPPGAYRLGRIDPRDRLLHLWGAALGERESVAVTMGPGDKLSRDLRVP